MKVHKNLIGKECRMKWRDPYNFITQSELEFKTSLKGWGSMPIWTEWGVIDDITDDVVRVVVAKVENSELEWRGFVVPAVLIEEITILSEGKDAKPEIQADSNGATVPA